MRLCKFVSLVALAAFVVIVAMWIVDEPAYADNQESGTHGRATKTRKSAARRKDAGASNKPDAAVPAEAVSSVWVARDVGERDAGAGSDAGDDDEDDTPSSGTTTKARSGGARGADGEEALDEDDDPDGWSIGAELGLASQASWRGVAESRSAVAEPSAQISLYNLVLEGWVDNVLNDEGDTYAFGIMEVGASLSYSYTFGKTLRVAPAARYYYFRADGRGVGEGALGVSYKLGSFRLVHESAVDLTRAGVGYFGTAGMEYRTWIFPLCSVLAHADVGVATANLNDDLFGHPVFALNVFEASLQARYHVTPWFYVSPQVLGSTLLAPSLRASVTSPTLVVGSLAVGFEYVSNPR
jgi:hypothetical protein